MCGGTIISSTHILTTASCLLAEKNVVHANLEILTGTNDLQRRDTISTWKIYKVAFVIIHNEYDPRNYWVNDIAILKLESRLLLDHDRVAATVSPESRSCKLFIVGWGINPVTGIMSRHLQRLDVESIRNNMCQYKFDSQQVLYRNQFCFIPKKKEARVTNGGAGSPVMYYRQIVGIISLISVNPKHPVIYTRTRQYNYWIEEMINKM
ncbi:complement factor D-like [Aphidius gifuensis]|nr:complement factor D-like [Aphidius gifuensis]